MALKLLKLFLVSSFFVLASCSHLKSGDYIQLQSSDTINKLAKEFGVTPAAIVSSNKNKEFRVGEWYFIPQEIGFARHLKNEITFGRGYGFSKKSLYVGKLLWPVPSSSRITSNYGRRWGRPHDGIDIAGRSGTSILAAEEGKVIYSGNGLKGYGNLIIIAHENGLRTVYAHNKKNNVRKGDKVVRGQVIGQVGATGKATGPHLHFEVRHYDRSLNPMSYIKKSRSILLSYRK